MSGVFAYQRFRAEGLAAFSPFSSAPAGLTDKGYVSSTGGGLRVGYLGELSDAVSFGGSYQTKIYMGKLSDYAELFAE